MPLVTATLGDKTTTSTGVGTAVCVGDLVDVYVSIGGAFGTATATVETTVDGTNWDTFGSTATTEKLVGPIPPCFQVRANTTAHGGTGTISYRLGGTRTRSARSMVGEVLCGAGANIATGVATTGSCSVQGCGPATVWLYSTNWVGTYVVKVSLDGGLTWGIYGSPVVVSSGTTDTSVTIPRCTHVAVVATTNTSGTMTMRYGAPKEPQI